MPRKWGVGASEICGRRQEIFLTLWFEVGASNEKPCLWRSVNVACADCSQLKPGAWGDYLGSQLSSSRWVSPYVLYCLLLACIFFFFFWGVGGWAREYGFSILGVNALLVYLFIIPLFYYLFIYLFLVKGLFTMKYKHMIFK